MVLLRVITLVFALFMLSGNNLRFSKVIFGVGRFKDCFLYSFFNSFNVLFGIDKLIASFSNMSYYSKQDYFVK